MTETVHSIASEMLMEADNLEDDTIVSMNEVITNQIISEELRKYARRILMANSNENVDKW